MARQADLLGADEARGRILARFRRVETHEVLLADALGRALAEDVISPLNVPPFANSSMDGFAVSSSDTHRAGVALRVAYHIAAGSTPREPIQPGTCARIMTGAPLPSGADAVIPFEEVEDSGESIRLGRAVSSGECVRPAGQDMTAGTPALRGGTEIGPAQIGVLASIGVGRVRVVRRPRVAILSTGDELVEPGEPLEPGQIYNSNAPMLAAAIREAGGEPLVLQPAKDDPAAIAAALRGAVGADLLLTSGGASVGDHDHLKDVLGAEGQVAFWRVRVRPGKPLLFGTLGGVPLLGLPGNPTSAMVTFEQFVRPAVRTMLGLPPMRAEVAAVLDKRIDNRGGRRTYARVRLRLEDGAFHATPAGPQDSAMLHPLAEADGLFVVPEERSEMEAGERGVVQVWRLRGKDV